LPSTEVSRIARAPGRVNLIGDHTDYTGGLCLPMAIDRWVEVKVMANPARPVVRLTSDSHAAHAVVPIDVAPGDIRRLDPVWARYPAGVIVEVRPDVGYVGTVKTTVPQGSGLSSSAALEVACALAFGAASDDKLALAQLCQRAEHHARGVPTGILDQLASVCGVEGSALVLDCHDLTVTPAPMPPATDVEVVVVWVHARSLGESGYSRRVTECRAAEAIIGPLRLATADRLDEIDDHFVRARARHVVTENQRVRDFAAALAAADLDAAGALMLASHESLRTDYACSTDDVDSAVERLAATKGVFGARMTGGGWGGSVVALCRPGALGDTGERVLPVAGAHVL
jgi:galactokinase